MENLQQELWRGYWNALEVEVDVPPLEVRRETAEALATYKIMPVYLPALREEDFPAGLTPPQWNNLNARDIERLPLVGRWVGIETVAKPQPGEAYSSRLLNVDRFTLSDQQIQETLPLLADRLRVAEGGVRLLSVEEWNLFASLCHWLRSAWGCDSLPNLGATNVWERCHNSYAGSCQLTMGYGDLAEVDFTWRDQVDSRIGFRLLVEL